MQDGVGLADWSNLARGLWTFGWLRITNKMFTLIIITSRIHKSIRLHYSKSHPFYHSGSPLTVFGDGNGE